MTLPVVLLLLRWVSALALLGFLAMIAWLIYRDMETTADMLAQQGQTHGHLRVVATEQEQPAVGTLYPLLPVTSIGRSAGNTIVLDDGYVSGEHALITHRGRHWWLEDLNSRNGTLLNETPLTETAVISSGDIIGIGSTRLKVEL